MHSPTQGSGQKHQVSFRNHLEQCKINFLENHCIIYNHSCCQQAFQLSLRFFIEKIRVLTRNYKYRFQLFFNNRHSVALRNYCFNLPICTLSIQINYMLTQHPWFPPEVLNLIQSSLIKTSTPDGAIVDTSYRNVSKLFLV